MEQERTDFVGFVYVMEGEQQGYIYKLYIGRNTLGTSSECPIRFDDPSISSKHASIRYEDTVPNFVIRDLDSTNGTFVNGEEIIKDELQENDVIGIGNTKLKLKML